MANDFANDLLNLLLPHAQNLLTKNGEFYPFGAKVNSSGESSLVAGMVDGNDHPNSQEVIDLLAAGMKAEAESGVIVASGICYDSKFNHGNSDMKDAVCCRIETNSGESMSIYLPYAIKTKFLSKSKDITYGELVGVVKDPEIWIDVVN